jgi:hypothetical protein
MGNVLLAGDFETTVDFGDGTLTSNGGYDAFVAKFDSMGGVLLSKSYGDASDQTARGIASDTAGNIIFAGDIEGTTDFGGGALMGTAMGVAFVAKLSPTGTHLFSKAFGDTEASAMGVVTDASSRVFITGSYNGKIDFGGGPLVSGIADDVFIGALDSKGAYVWGARFGDDSAQHANAIAIGTTGKIAVAGDFTGVLDFGGAKLTSAGNYDAFVVELDPAAGCPIWAKGFGDAQHQGADGVAESATGVVATGSFSGSIDLGGSPITAAGADLFITKLPP